MNWLNLKTSKLREPEFIGSDPDARAAWLCVLTYCVEMENGGRIRGARLWKDRQWQQTCGVTLTEIQGATSLLTWDGDDLLIWSYPAEKQDEVQAKRDAGRKGGRASTDAKAEAARLNGSKGGQPKHEPKQNPSTNPTERKGKEKGKEGERNTPEEPSPPPAPRRAVADADEEWISGIEAMECYKPLTIRTELGKAQAWARNNHRKCTRRFFINWLNRALEGVHVVATAAPPPPDYLKTEWPSWLAAQKQPFIEYQFAAEFLKSDFHKDRKAKAA